MLVSREVQTFSLPDPKQMLQANDGLLSPEEFADITIGLRSPHFSAERQFGTDIRVRGLSRNGFGDFVEDPVRATLF